MIDFGWLTEPVWGGYGIAAACVLGLLSTIFWVAFGTWCTGSFPLRRRRRPIPINCRDCGSLVMSSDIPAHYAPKYAGGASTCATNRAAKEMVAEAKASKPSAWSEYLHDAEFMDLDLFVAKWRDKKKPERPKAPVICNYRDGCRNLMASNAPCCDSCDLKNQREFLARNDEANARAEAYAKEALAAQVKAVKETEDERLARLALKLSDVQRESIRRRYQSGLCKCDKGWGACIAAHKCPNCGDWCI